MVRFMGHPACPNSCNFLCMSSWSEHSPDMFRHVHSRSSPLPSARPLKRKKTLPMMPITVRVRNLGLARFLHVEIIVGMRELTYTIDRVIENTQKPCIVRAKARTANGLRRTALMCIRSASNDITPAIVNGRTHIAVIAHVHVVDLVFLAVAGQFSLHACLLSDQHSSALRVV